jgi:hypothetical protein
MREIPYNIQTQFQEHSNRSIEQQIASSEQNDITNQQIDSEIQLLIK